MGGYTPVMIVPSVNGVADGSDAALMPVWIWFLVAHTLAILGAKQKELPHVVPDF